VQLRDALAGIDVLALRGDQAVDVRDVTHDSRRCGPGTLFCCVPGAHTDGHEFAGAAVAAGASALLVERLIAVDAPLAQVAGVRSVMGPVAARVYGEPSRAMRVIGVTGTNGKTTTVHLLEAIARAAGERPGSIGTVGARIDDQLIPLAHTTPEAPDIQALLARMRDESVQNVAMEVSSEGIAQGRADGIWFAAACFTNLTQDHLNFHGTMDNYFAAKAALFSPERTKAAAINAGDEYGRRLIARAKTDGLTITTFALADVDGAGDADVVARDVALGRDHTHFELVDTRTGAQHVITMTLVGRHNVANAVAAAASALAAGMPFAAVAHGLSQPLVVPGRLEPVNAGQPFSVLVDYAHTPDALERVLDAVRPLASSDGRVLVVFGCGGDRDRDKRPLMGEVAGRLADVVIVSSDNPRSEPPAAIADAIVRGVRAAGAEPHVELDRRAAIAYAVAKAAPGDVVLVAGKGHETGQTAGGVTVPFDDRVVAREEIDARCG
jgi:UDP-N-acetylmuramoyl-L-alanyl-D-glutamate--2,6-diaminopimelate ligase